MNLTIITADGAVYVDGHSFSGLVFSAPANVHALQWKGTKGWIEFIDNDDGTKPENQAITELPSWAVEAKAKWDEEKSAAEAAAAAAAAQPTASGAQTL